MTIISSVAGMALSLTQRMGGIFSRLWSCNFTRCPPLSFWLWEIWKSRGLNSKQNSILLRFHALHSIHALRVSGKHTNMKAGWNSSCETAPFPTFVAKSIGRPHLQTSTPKFRSISTAANLENHLYASLNPWLKFDPKRTTQWCSTVSIQCCDKDQVNSCESSGMCNNTFASEDTFTLSTDLLVEPWALSVDTSISPSQNPLCLKMWMKGQFFLTNLAPPAAKTLSLESRTSNGFLLENPTRFSLPTHFI